MDTPRFQNYNQTSKLYKFHQRYTPQTYQWWISTTLRSITSRRTQNTNQYDSTLRSLLQGHTHLIRSLQNHNDLTTPKPTSIPLPTEHKPISSWPDQTSFSVYYLRKSFGFRNIDNILKEIQQTAAHNFSLSTKDRKKSLTLAKSPPSSNLPPTINLFRYLPNLDQLSTWI